MLKPESMPLHLTLIIIGIYLITTQANCDGKFELQCFIYCKRLVKQKCFRQNQRNVQKNMNRIIYILRIDFQHLINLTTYSSKLNIYNFIM